MLFAMLAYHEGGLVESWTSEADDAVMDALYKVHARLDNDGKLGPAARLGPTSEAATIRGEGRGVVIDGPFAETKEHLLGLYVLACADREEAIEIAREFRAANPSAVYEIRPIPVYLPGAPLPAVS